MPTPNNGTRKTHKPTGPATLDQLQGLKKTVLVRCDLNVPVASGTDGQPCLTDVTRIRRTAPTLRELCDAGAKVVVMSHFGRPKGKPVPELSLAPLRKAVQSAVGRPTLFAGGGPGKTGLTTGEDVKSMIGQMNFGEILILENTRFHAGEEANDAEFAKQLAALGDVFVNDAFSAAHRAHASTVGITAYLPSYAGRALEGELANLERALETPEKPSIALVGGAKVSTKLALIGTLMEKSDFLIIGGAMANTFLAAQGFPVGTSLYEAGLLETANRILEKSEQNACELLLPLDVRAADRFDNEALSAVYDLKDVPDNRMILDVGPKTVALLKDKIAGCKTLVWNGPLGAFEMDAFAAGTVAVAQAAAAQTARGNLVSVAGGGDTVAALVKAGVTGDGGFTYISTAGGAFLEWLEGKTLPGVAALPNSKKV